MTAERDIAALIAYLEERAQCPFGWQRGKECVGFSLGGVLAQTGVDLLADIPGWKSRRAALRVAAELGGLEAALDARMDRVPPALAMRGDVAGLPDRAFGVRLMLVEGRYLAGPGTHGLERVPRDAMTIAWSAATARRIVPGGRDR